jgi:hypothetical protein
LLRARQLVAQVEQQGTGKLEVARERRAGGMSQSGPLGGAHRRPEQAALSDSGLARQEEEMTLTLARGRSPTLAQGEEIISPNEHRADAWPRLHGASRPRF